MDSVIMKQNLIKNIPTAGISTRVSKEESIFYVNESHARKSNSAQLNILLQTTRKITKFSRQQEYN